MWVSVSGRNSVGSSISGSESSTSSTRGWDIFKEEPGRSYERRGTVHGNVALLTQHGMERVSASSIPICCSGMCGELAANPFAVLGTALHSLVTRQVEYEEN